MCSHRWLSLAVALLLSGCGSFAAAPDRVARDFWQALADGDVPGAKALSTEVDTRRLTRISQRHPIEEVEVGSVLTRGEVADVETTLQRDSGQVAFRTRLQRFEEGWRVDVAASGQALRAAVVDKSLSELEDAFSDGAGAIGEAVGRGLEQAAEAIHQALDELERERPERSPAP